MENTVYIYLVGDLMFSASNCEVRSHESFKANNNVMTAIIYFESEFDLSHKATR